MVNVCEFCGAALDPGERCDCQDRGLALRCIQAPVISEDLEGIRRQMDLVLAEVRQLPANDESLKRIRAIRAELSRQFEEMETQRKEVRRQVLQPYTQAEEKYKACIAEPYKAADHQLKEWVDNYQNGMKMACEARLREYFEELCVAHGVDFLRFEQAGVTVDMATARQKEPRKAMEMLESFVLRVRADLDTILKMEDSAEILAAYRIKLNLPEAILGVVNHKAAVERAVQQIREAMEARDQEEQNRRQFFDAVPELRDQLSQENIYSMTFTVTGTLPDLKALKVYILSSNLTLEEDIHDE